jgi:hypothetical protein
MRLTPTPSHDLGRRPDPEHLLEPADDLVFDAAEDLADALRPGLDAVEHPLDDVLAYP